MVDHGALDDTGRRSVDIERLTHINLDPFARADHLPHYRH